MVWKSKYNTTPCHLWNCFFEKRIPSNSCLEKVHCRVIEIMHILLLDLLSFIYIKVLKVLRIGIKKKLLYFAYPNFFNQKKYKYSQYLFHQFINFCLNNCMFLLLVLVRFPLLSQLKWALKELSNLEVTQITHFFVFWAIIF